MAYGSKAKIYRCDDTTIADENRTEEKLMNRRVSKGLYSSIISLTQLINEGWTMQSKHAKKKERNTHDEER